MMLFKPLKGSYIFSGIIFAVLYSALGCNSKKSTEQASSTRTGAPVEMSKASKSALQPAGYKVYQSFLPQMLPGNKQVTVCLLQDERLTGPTASVSYYPGLHAAQLMFHSDEEAFNPDGPEYKPAILLTKGGDGNVISYNILDVPYARIDSAYLDEQKTKLIYLFTLDYSIGMGSYNGPATYFVGFADTGMVNYNAGNSFASTLKTAWAMRYTANGMEVWSKICRPGDNDDFNTATEKAVWQDGSFKITKVVKSGIWENDGSDGAEGMREFIDGFSE